MRLPGAVPAVAEARKEHALIACALLLAALLRLYNLGGMGLGIDEGLTKEIITGGKLNDVYITSDYNPPLYYFIVTPIYNATNDFYFVRLFSVAMSLFSLAVAYLIFRRIAGWKTAVAGLFLLAVNPMFLFYSRHMRSYALFVIIALLIFWLLLRLDFSRKRSYVQIALLNLLLLYVHHYSLFVLAAEALFMYSRKNRFATSYSLLALAVPLAMFLPWVYYVYNIGIAVSPDFFATTPTQVQYPSPEYLFYLFYKMSVGVDISTLIAYQPVFLAVFPLAAAALLGGLHFAYARNKPLLFLCLALASTVATALLFSLVLRPIFYFRYFSFLIPFMALLQAYGFGQLKDRRVAALGYLLLFAGQLGLDLLYYQLSATGEWGNLIGL